jgi:hypothetical protein
LGALTLSATSTIDFGLGDNGNKLVFSGVGTHIANTILQIANWEGAPFTGNGSEQLLFAGNTTDFTNVYNQADVIFNGITGYDAIQFAGFYEITAIPEPSTWIAAALALATLLYGRLRFRKRPLARSGRSSRGAAETAGERSNFTASLATSIRLPKEPSGNRSKI